MKPITARQRAKNLKRLQTIYAYHEAGHAVDHWLFMTPEHLVHIDMRGTDELWGFVRSRTFQMLTVPIMIEAGQLRMARAETARFIVLQLSGPCAQSIFENGSNCDFSEWLYALYDEYLGDENDASDIARAFKAARLIYPDSQPKQYRFVEMVAKWTHEAYSMPEVWACVTALAKRLKPGIVMDGDEAFHIMERAWTGRNDFMPIAGFGRKWRNRFFAPITPPAT